MEVKIVDNEKILELYKLLGITQDEYPQYPQSYDINTPYEKCSITVNVPTTIGNASTPRVNKESQNV